MLAARRSPGAPARARRGARGVRRGPGLVAGPRRLRVSCGPPGGARLRELRAQSSAGDSSDRSGRGRRRRSAPSPRPPAQRERAGASCGAMLHCRRFSPRPSRRHPEAAPRRRGRLSPWEGGIRALNDYEILLLLDPELAEERGQRDHPAHPRARRGRRRHLGRPRAVGPPPLAYEIDHKGEAVYHLLLFTAPAGDARRDHARAQDHRRRHAPRRVPPRQGRRTRRRRRRSPSARPPRPRPHAPPMTPTGPRSSLVDP